MIEDLICVQDTDYGEYFEKAGSNTVFLLGEKSAEAAWDSEVYGNASSYFNLPDDCWIVSGESNSIGDWMDSYNNDENSAVEKLLREAVDWSDDAIVRFFVKKKIVFQSNWRDFLRYWDEFLAIEDDCPILLPRCSYRKEALLFRSVGDIFKIG